MTDYDLEGAGLRIVSFLPSATEIVYALGLGSELVGVSHECDFPPDAKGKPKMIEPAFDTRQLESERIDQLVIEYTKRGERLYKIRFDEFRNANPDLVITQELCDVCAIGAEDVLAAVNQLKKPVKVVSLNPHSLSDIESDIRSVAKAAGRRASAERLIAELDDKAETIRKLTENSQKPRVFCVEWLKPIMNAGHWVPEMVEYAGGIDKLAERGQPSRYIEWDSVSKYDPEVIVLMPCGFTTSKTMEQARHFFQTPSSKRLSAVRNDRVYATDGHNYFSRSGPRLFDGIRTLAQVIHPELFNEALDPQLAKRVEAIRAEL
ncbi:MAG: cobalamin-binding protein [Candidatus Bathyarchaeia archaeon]|jgi:iron complex transport system substrate-binding protein